jgi:hypothetical protein
MMGMMYNMDPCCHQIFAVTDPCAKSRRTMTECYALEGEERDSALRKEEDQQKSAVSSLEANSGRERLMSINRSVGKHRN